MKLQGCGTALITPFKQDQSIDEDRLRRLVEWQIDSGIHFLVPCGTTGETPTLSKDEWLRVIDITIEVAAGRVPIVAGATSNSTADAVEKAQELGGRKGVDAILTASPYYNKPTQEGQYQHFKAIAVASNEMPREMSEMTCAVLNNDWKKARQLHRKYVRLMQANFIESNPMPVKAVLAMMGRVEEVYRLPMLPMKADTRAKLQQVAAEAGLLNSHAAVSDL